MMSFCKRSVHSLLGLTIPMNLDSNSVDHKPSVSSSKSLAALPLSSGGLGLITATGDSLKTPNVLESASVKPSPPPSPSPPFKKDPGGIGFIDDVGGGVNGLMSCTESLGFESCDERRVDDEIELCSSPRSTACKINWRKVYDRRREVKKFPPPISSLNHNGQPCFFLRPVRKDGRLELTEIRIDRPEILRASRQDGRLRLHLVRNDELDDISEETQVQDQENEQEEIKEEEEVEEKKEEEEEEEVEEEEEEEEEDEETVEEEEEEEVGSGEWRFPVTGEGFRRCHELVSHHHDYHHHHQHSNHHHNLHVWRQHCVTTR